MQYELLYIVPTSFTDEDVGQVESNVKALLEKYGATVDETKRLGKFRLAYPIDKVRHGHYVLVMLTTEPANVSKVDTALRLSNDILRHLLLRADEAGGGKFDLIQFVEVNIEGKEDRPRRKREDGVMEPRKVDEVKADEVKLEIKPVLTDEELDKKIDAVIPNL